MATSPATDPSALPGERPSLWFRLLGALGAAADAKTLLLAALGVLLTRGGWAVIDWSFGYVPGTTRAEVQGDGRVPAGFSNGSELVDALQLAAMTMTEPLRVLVGPGLGLFAIDQGNAAFLRFSVAGVWSVLVWGLIGGALARIAVVRSAGSLEGVGIVPALRYTVWRFGSLVASPLGPLLAVAVLAVPGALIGILYRLFPPNPLWDQIAGALAFIPLLLAVPMALLLLGLASGWPLMVLTVAAEGEDGFDAVSRSYSYLSRRAGRYVLAVSMSWAAGAAGLLLVGLFARLVIHLGAWALALGAVDHQIEHLFQWQAPIESGLVPDAGARVPPSLQQGGLWLRSTFDGLREPAPQGIHDVWLRTVGLLAYAWAYSYFWSAFSRIYLLIRYEVDGTPWHDIHRPEHDRDAIDPEFEPDASGPPPSSDEFKKEDGRG